jgi:hypothetical protein
MHDRRAKLISIVTRAPNDLGTGREFAGSYEANLPILTLTVVKVLSGCGKPGKAGGAENGKEDVHSLLDCHRSLDFGQRTSGRGRAGD